MGDTHQRAKAELGHFTRAKHFHLHPERGELLAAFGHFDRVEHIRRLTHQIAREINAIGQRLAGHPGGFGFGQFVGQHRQLREFGLIVGLFFGAIKIEAIAAQGGAQCGGGGLGAGQASGRQGGDGITAELGRSGTARVFQPGTGQICGFAQADSHHTRQPGTGGEHNGGLALLAGEIRHRQRAGDRAAGCGIGRGQHLARWAIGVFRDQQRQGAGFGQGRFGKGDVEHVGVPIR